MTVFRQQGYYLFNCIAHVNAVL